MDDMDRELRSLLQEKAGEVPRHREIPGSLTRRVRRRVALNAVAVGAALVLLAGGAFAGVRAFTQPSSPILPVSHHSPHPHRSAKPAPRQSTPTPSESPSAEGSTAVTACTAGQLRAVGTMDGAAGSREGTVGVSNFSDQICTLEGAAEVSLLDDNLNPITSGVTFSSSPAQWEADGSPQPAGWPVVTLKPGDAASVRIRWSNWCPDGRTAPLWRMQIPGDQPINVYGLDAVYPPPCNGPGMPSTIEVGPFEPSGV
jgi:hypothetical protein